MDTYLIITDITGKQYTHLLDDEGLKIADFNITSTNTHLDKIQTALETLKTIKVKTRIFRVEHIVEMSIIEIPKGAY